MALFRLCSSPFFSFLCLCSPCLGGDDIGCSPPVSSSSSSQAAGCDSCCCFSTTPSSATIMLFHHCSSSSSSQAAGCDPCCCFSTTTSSATTMLFHHCSSSPTSSQKQTRSSSSSSSPSKLHRPSCSVRSKIHVNGHEYVLCCSGWCSNALRRSRSMTSASNGSGKMVGHGSLSPVLLSVLLVPLFVLALPRRRLAGVATHILFRMLAFVLRFRIVVSLPFLQQSRPAGFDSRRLRNPTPGAPQLCNRCMACRRASE